MILSRTPHDIAQDALKNITFELVCFERDYPLGHQDIQLIIERHIKNAYNQVAGSDRTKLYHSLLIHIRHERLINSHKSVYDFLNDRHLLQLLKSAVIDLNTGNLFYDVALDPLGGVGSIFNYVAQMLSPLLAKSKRYQPVFKKGTTALLWLLNSAMIASCLLVGFAILLAALIVRYVDSLLTLLISKVFDVASDNSNEIIGLDRINRIFSSGAFATKNYWMRGLMVLIIPFITVGILFVETMRYLYSGLIIATCAAATVYLVATLCLINSPLYLLDAYRFFAADNSNASIFDNDTVNSPAMIKKRLAAGMSSLNLTNNSLESEKNAIEQAPAPFQVKNTKSKLEGAIKDDVPPASFKY